MLKAKYYDEMADESIHFCLSESGSTSYSCRILREFQLYSPQLSSKGNKNSAVLSFSFLREKSSVECANRPLSISMDVTPSDTSEMFERLRNGVADRIYEHVRMMENDFLPPDMEEDECLRFESAALTMTQHLIRSCSSAAHDMLSSFETLDILAAERRYFHPLILTISRLF